MRTGPDHKIEFRWVDDTKIELQDILNPTYVYKINDKIDISYYTFGDKDKGVQLNNVRVEVVDVSQEIIESILYEQLIVIHIKKV